MNISINLSSIFLLFGSSILQNMVLELLPTNSIKLGGVNTSEAIRFRQLRKSNMLNKKLPSFGGVSSTGGITPGIKRNIFFDYSKAEEETSKLSKSDSFRMKSVERKTKRARRRRLSLVDAIDDTPDVTTNAAPVTNTQIKFYDIVREDEELVDDELSVS